jgi:hypothetical protein
MTGQQLAQLEASYNKCSKLLEQIYVHEIHFREHELQAHSSYAHTLKRRLNDELNKMMSFYVANSRSFSPPSIKRSSFLNGPPNIKNTRRNASRAPPSPNGAVNAILAASNAERRAATMRERRMHELGATAVYEANGI